MKKFIRYFQEHDLIKHLRDINSKYYGSIIPHRCNILFYSYLTPLKGLYMCKMKRKMLQYCTRPETLQKNKGQKCSLGHSSRAFLQQCFYTILNIYLYIISSYTKGRIRNRGFLIIIIYKCTTKSITEIYTSDAKCNAI